MSSRAKGPTRDGVTASASTLGMVVAVCTFPGCGLSFSGEALPGQNRVTSRTRRHVASTGHRVLIATTREVEFMPDE